MHFNMKLSLAAGTCAMLGLSVAITSTKKNVNQHPIETTHLVAPLHQSLHELCVIVALCASLAPWLSPGQS